MENESELNVIKAVFSNRLERLADVLSTRLFALGSSAFQRRYVLVPNDLIKEFLVFYLAPRLDIAAGMLIFPLEQGITELLEHSMHDVKKHSPSFLGLTLHIQEQMHICFSRKNQNFLFAPLYEYIECQGKDFCDKRIVSLSDQIAHLFIRYGLHGGSFLSHWLKQQGWQQWIWKQVFSKDISSLESLNTKKIEGVQIHLFGFSYLPPLYLSFFARSQAIFYQFSPCAHYWEDACSEKERVFIEKKLNSNKQSAAICEEMRAYLEDTHPLLANWGKLGREFLKVLDHYDLDRMDSYDLSPPTLLGHLKNTILLMQDMARPDDVKQDDSIQIHSSPSKLREVEALKDIIHTLLEKHRLDVQPLEPKDILILAPDIADYASYIQMVFSGTSLAFCIEGLEQGSTSVFLQGLFHFFSFFEEEFSFTNAFKLFSCSAFRAKWGFSQEDVDLIFSWLERAHIRTGEKSWERGLDRLLWGLAMISSDASPVYPLPCIAHSDLELFDKFLNCYRSLEQDISLLRSQERKTIIEWLVCIQQIAQRHFDCADEDSFMRDLHSLCNQTADISGKYWSFESIRGVLRYFYEKRNGKIATKHLQKLSFCSMNSLGARSSRVVCILGLDEEHFPRLDVPISLCELVRSKTNTYFPVKGDEDRYLFLELLCHAQDYFILSYERIHPLDNKSQGPCYLIEELCTYVHKKFSITLPTIHHSFLPFDAMYFSPEAVVKNRDSSDYHLALAYYATGRKQRYFFKSSDSQHLVSDEVIEIHSLRKLAKDPIRFYFNEILGMYLKQEEDQEKDAYCLSRLKKHLLKRDCLQNSFVETIQKSQRQGVLPEGIFKETTIYALSLELDEYMQSFKNLNIKGNALFSIELSMHCHAAFRCENGNWILPALKIDLERGHTVHIIGTLFDIAPQGYVTDAKSDLEGLLAAWPLYLIFLNVKKAMEDVGGDILFSKNGNRLGLDGQDPHLLLKRYIAYFLRARIGLSPFKPKWASCILLKSVKAFEKLWCTEMENEGFFYKDPYLEWMKQSRISLDPEEMFEKWAPYLRENFAPILSLLP